MQCNRKPGELDACCHWTGDRTPDCSRWPAPTGLDPLERSHRATRTGITGLNGLDSAEIVDSLNRTGRTGLDWTGLQLTELDWS